MLLRSDSMSLFLVADAAQRWRNKRLNYWVISDPIYCRQITANLAPFAWSDYLPALPETNHRLLLTICVFFCFFFLFPQPLLIANRGEERKLGKEEQKKTEKTNKSRRGAGAAAAASCRCSIIGLSPRSSSAGGDAIALQPMGETDTNSNFFLSFFLVFLRFVNYLKLRMYEKFDWNCVPSIFFRIVPKAHVTAQPSHANLTQRSSTRDELMRNVSNTGIYCSKVSSDEVL